MHEVLPYILSVVLLVIGIYAVTVKKNLIKVIVGVIIIHNAVNLFLLLPGYRAPDPGVLTELRLVQTYAAVEESPAAWEAMAPIVMPVGDEEWREEKRFDFLARSVDPVPQALILTAIVIGLSVTALMVVMAVRLHEKYGTFDLTEIRKLKG